MDDVKPNMQIYQNLYANIRMFPNELDSDVFVYPARALRALGLLLADRTPTVGGGKTF